jgi:YaaC-like Protein
MSLPEARQGESIGFSIYPKAEIEITLGNPEAIIWSSIRHLCSQRAAEWHLWKIHKIYNKKTRSAVASNVGLYVRQASEFYDAASNAKPNTAPLFYYYSFLNLAKAICEIRRPRLHRREECYAHGLSWRPDPSKVVKFDAEQVTVRGRGIWHLLWESVMQEPYPAADRTRLSVMELFSYCPEVGVEFGTIFGPSRRRIYLEKIEAVHDASASEVWLRFSITRERIRNTGLSAPALLAQMASTRTTYVEVRSEDRNLRTFQSRNAARLMGRATPYSALRRDILRLNLITHYGDELSLEYSFPLQQRLPLPMPQLMVSYTLLFWLGSLVRYDPHSVYQLSDSPYWILIDGFMTQSRVWLLELFWWALYQNQIILKTAR